MQRKENDKVNKKKRIGNPQRVSLTFGSDMHVHRSSLQVETMARGFRNTFSSWETEKEIRRSIMESNKFRNQTKYDVKVQVWATEKLFRNINNREPQECNEPQV